MASINRNVNNAEKKQKTIVKEYEETEISSFVTKANYTVFNFPPCPDGIDQEYWKSLKSNFKRIQGETMLKIENIPFDAGQTSFAFKI